MLPMAAPFFLFAVGSKAKGHIVRARRARIFQLLGWTVLGHRHLAAVSFFPDILFGSRPAPFADALACSLPMLHVRGRP